MRNPPVDPVFTILVAIMTIILSIPMIIILSTVLENQASRWPGMNDASELDDKLDKADQDNMKEEEFKREQALNAETIEDGEEEGEEGEEGGTAIQKAPERTEDIYQSQFGLLLNSGILRGSLGVVNSPSETIYTGLIPLLLLLLLLLSLSLSWSPGNNVALNFLLFSSLFYSSIYFNFLYHLVLS